MKEIFWSSSIVKISFFFRAFKKTNHMPTQITPNVSFTNVSRELRCKWRDETSLTECQDGIYNGFFLFASSSSLRARHVEKSFVFVVTPFFTDLKIHFDIICSSHRCAFAQVSCSVRLGIYSPRRVRGLSRL